MRDSIIAIAFVVGSSSTATADEKSATRPSAAPPSATVDVALFEPLYVPGQEHIRITPPSMTDVDPDLHAAAENREFLRQAASTRRYEIGAGVTSVASFPGSIDDGPAPYLSIGKPIWQGTRWRFFQWTADTIGTGSIGTHSHSAHVDAAVRLGFNLYLGGVFGFEIKMGPVVAAQLGERTVAALGFVGDGGYVFRFWKDDRKRIKLGVRMRNAFWLAQDAPGNDLGTNAMALGFGLAYEQPY